LGTTKMKPIAENIVRCRGVEGEPCSMVVYLWWEKSKPSASNEELKIA